MAGSEVPLFDPKVHTADDALVRLEVYCACGGLKRWGPDPVRHIAPQLRSFEAEHHGPGHGPVSAEKSLAEREARREAGFRAAGRGHEYRPKVHDPGSGETTEWTPAAPRKVTEENRIR